MSAYDPDSAYLDARDAGLGQAAAADYAYDVWRFGMNPLGERQLDEEYGWRGDGPEVPPCRTLPYSARLGAI